MSSKTHSFHFILAKGTEYRDLVPVFPDILNLVLAENDHFQKPEDEESHEMFVYMNMADLQDNRKPEGYNRKAKYRLIFPNDNMEFYIKSFTANCNGSEASADKKICNDDINSKALFICFQDIPRIPATCHRAIDHWRRRRGQPFR